MKTCLSFEGHSRVLFVGIGGGGDVITAAVLAESYERCGGRAGIGSIIWERFVVDLEPGPILVEQLENAELIHRCAALIHGNSFARRRWGAVVPQAARVAKALGRSVFAFDVGKGHACLAEAFDVVMSLFGFDAVIGIDVGGDVLAKGYEENLWSPLADSVSLAALSMTNGRTFLGVVGAGVDGEFEPEYVIERILEFAKVGALEGGYILGEAEAQIFSELLKDAVTESGKNLLLALMGHLGEVKMRSGSRSAKLTPWARILFLLKPHIVAENTVARLVKSAKDLQDARRILNSYCIFTELDLEEIIEQLYIQGIDLQRIDLNELKRKKRSELCETRKTL